MKDIEQHRPGFEAWARANGFRTERRDDPDSPDAYFRYETEERWKVWTAAKLEASTEPSADVDAYPIADALYERGYRDARNEHDWDARGCDEWQAVVDAIKGGAAQKDEAKDAAPSEIEIVSGFFAGRSIKVDPRLPPDTVEVRGKNRVRVNIRTGIITEIPAQAKEQEPKP